MPMISPVPFIAPPAVLGSSPPRTTCDAGLLGRLDGLLQRLGVAVQVAVGDRDVVLHGHQRGVAVGRHPRRGDAEDVVERGQPVGETRSARTRASGASSWTTTWAEVLPDAGRCSRSRSTPCCAGAAGTSQSSWVWPPTAPATPKTATASDQPDGEGAPRVGGGEPAEPVEDAVHHGLLGSSVAETVPRRACGGLVTDLGALLVGRGACSMVEPGDVTTPLASARGLDHRSAVARPLEGVEVPGLSQTVVSETPKL